MSQTKFLISACAAPLVFLIIVLRLPAPRRKDGLNEAESARLTIVVYLVAALVLLQAFGELRYGSDSHFNLPAGLNRKLQTPLKIGLLLTLTEFMLHQSWRRGASLEWTLRIACLPFAAAWVVAVQLGAIPGASRDAWLVWFTFLALAFSLDDGPELLAAARRLARIMVGASLVAALLSPAWSFAPYLAWPGGWRPGLDRLQGVFPQPNPLGWFAAFALLIELFGVRPRSRTRLPWAAAAAACLVLSGSRSAALAFLVGLFLGAMTSNSGRRLRTPKYVASLGALAILAVGTEELLTASGAQTSGVNGRTQTWAAAIQVFRRNPNFGSGPGAYRHSSSFFDAVPYAHNQILHTAAEGGILALLALAWLTFVLVKRLFDPARNAVGVAVTGAWLTLYGTENLLRFTEMTFFLPVLLALLSWGYRVDSSVELSVRVRSSRDQVAPATRRQGIGT